MPLLSASFLIFPMLVVQIKKDCCCCCSYYNEPPSQAFDAANSIDGRTEVAVARRILVTMTPQALSYNKDIIHFALRMQFITDITSTAFTAILINVVRGA